ncbi:hypothetical protein MERGE_000795 [Pneumocystis wakefieldiae]|uniref:tRNA-dihydrouridine synthase n=1 Tax=Pneumocystis wakefieldiae TaxID=38082 RepID=A0A899G1C7_9ASCO|nr:hypothetical protein MERGE_000795 [Pneumocystis wakefieldiae]
MGLRCREFWNSIGSPSRIVAPMVDQSELAWRILSRRHGADLCYTPMFHAKKFWSSPRYRKNVWSTLDNGEDRPLIVQFCANDPEDFLKASRIVVGKCDAVDLNLGCPQNIARRGHYGAYLQENWDLISKIIKHVNEFLDIPITAKIRIFLDKEKTLAYAQMIVEAGVSILAIHGRTREQKGNMTGLSDWNQILYLRENLPSNIVIFSNGNILWPHDIDKCLKETKADGVMSAEGNLYNPSIFNRSDTRSVITQIAKEYLDIIVNYGLENDKSCINAVKPHLFKILRTGLSKYVHLRDELRQVKSNELEKCFKIIEELDILVKKAILENNDEEKIQWWHCQPYIRSLSELPTKSP